MQNFQFNCCNKFQSVVLSLSPLPIYSQPMTPALSTSFRTHTNNAANQISSINENNANQDSVYCNVPFLDYNNNYYYPSYTNTIPTIVTNWNNTIPPVIYNGTVDHQNDGWTTKFEEQYPALDYNYNYPNYNGTVDHQNDGWTTKFEEQYPDLDYNYNKNNIILPTVTDGNNITPPVNEKIDENGSWTPKFEERNLPNRIFTVNTNNTNNGNNGKNQDSIPILQNNIMMNYNSLDFLPAISGNNIISSEIWKYQIEDQNHELKFSYCQKGTSSSRELIFPFIKRYQELYDLTNDRKSIEEKIARKYPKEGVSYRNIVEPFCLPKIYTHVDKFILDQQLERSEITMLLVMVEDAIGKRQEIDNVRQNVNTWDDYINLACKCRANERSIIENDLPVPPCVVRDIECYIAKLSIMVPEIHKGLWLLALLSHI